MGKNLTIQKKQWRLKLIQTRRAKLIIDQRKQFSKKVKTFDSKRKQSRHSKAAAGRLQGKGGRAGTELVKRVIRRQRNVRMNEERKRMEREDEEEEEGWESRMKAQFTVTDRRAEAVDGSWQRKKRSSQEAEQENGQDQKVRNSCRKLENNLKSGVNLETDTGTGKTACVQQND